MPQVGIRKLKNETSEIIRTVREEGAEYIVTYRGEPVAVIRPFPDEAEPESAAGVRPDAAFWEELDALAAEIDAAWTSDKTAVELIEEQRREL